MDANVRLLDPNNTKLPRGKRKMKAIAATATFLIFSSLYILSRNNIPQPPIHRYNYVPPTSFATYLETENPPSDYLVWSPSCRIPYVNPFAKDAMQIFKVKKYIACTSQRLSNVVKDTNGNGVLHLNVSSLEKSLNRNEWIECCYSNVTRSEEPKISDSKIVKSKCMSFNSSVLLGKTEEFVLVKCELHGRKSPKTVYEDAHINIQITDPIKNRFDTANSNDTKPPWNVLIIGIDTLSRINLARAMPKTNDFFKQNHWLDFQGYNKMDDNTYPNLMAILTGKNQSRARKTCDSTGENSADNCDFMWKRYRNVGYVTAYAEDYVGISTFGRPLHSGFTVPPTDHYLRPLFIAAEKKSKSKSQYVYCTGKTTSGELVFDYAMDFVKTYERHPFFGFFWMNTFSHDDINSPSTMDAKVYDFFARLNQTNAMNTTIVIFISDHGLRFGEMRYLLTGYYEERLPAFFVWLPQAFRENHREAFKGMQTNTKRFTTPYDLYVTLQDVLSISEKVNSPPTASEGCPLCQSLFQTVPWNRSCEESSIAPHWCTCNPFQKLSPKHKIGNEAIKYIIEVEIEKALDTVNTEHCRICAKLTLDKALNIYLYKYLQVDSDFDDYLVVFSTKPGTMVFEATVRHFLKSDRFEAQGIVSRLTAYRGKGGCVKTAYLKKYCYCTNNKCK